jgi:hypothetical protein
VAQPAPRVTELVLQVSQLNGRLIACGDALVGSIGLAQAIGKGWSRSGRTGTASAPLTLTAKGSALRRSAMRLQKPWPQGLPGVWFAPRLRRRSGFSRACGRGWKPDNQEIG